MKTSRFISLRTACAAAAILSATAISAHAQKFGGNFGRSSAAVASRPQGMQPVNFSSSSMNRVQTAAPNGMRPTFPAAKPMNGSPLNSQAKANPINLSKLPSDMAGRMKSADALKAKPNASDIAKVGNRLPTDMLKKHVPIPDLPGKPGKKTPPIDPGDGTGKKPPIDPGDGTGKKPPKPGDNGTPKPPTTPTPPTTPPTTPTTPTPPTTPGNDGNGNGQGNVGNGNTGDGNGIGNVVGNKIVNLTIGGVGGFAGGFAGGYAAGGGDYAAPVAYAEPVAASPIPVETPVNVLNPAATGVALKFVVGGDVGVLEAGNSVKLPAETIIEFDRGGDFGMARYTLSKGDYTFTLTEKGWELYQGMISSPAIRSGSTLISRN